jgi:hypothetical protein
MRPVTGALVSRVARGRPLEHSPAHEHIADEPLVPEALCITSQRMGEDKGDKTPSGREDRSPSTSYEVTHIDNLDGAGTFPVAHVHEVVAWLEGEGTAWARGKKGLS